MQIEMMVNLKCSFWIGSIPVKTVALFIVTNDVNYSEKQLTFKVKLLLLFIVRMGFAPSVQHHRYIGAYARSHHF
jgi:hypothetical protein